MLRFQVGVFTYTVHLVRGPLMHNGVEVAGLFQSGRQRVLISDRAHPELRKETIVHELRHAWHHHYPFDIFDEESHCKAFGLVMMSILNQWMVMSEEIETLCDERWGSE